MIRSLFAALIVMALMCASALAVLPDEILDDPALESRARVISAELRCLVCQNQSIDDSDAELARDLRLLVRERLLEGDSNAEVFDYVVARYGEFVLLKPAISAQNLFLWIAAPVVLLIGLALLLTVGWRRASLSAQRVEKDVPSELTDDERAALARLNDREA